MRRDHEASLRLIEALGDIKSKSRSRSAEDGGRVAQTVRDAQRCTNALPHTYMQTTLPLLLFVSAPGAAPRGSSLWWAGAHSHPRRTDSGSAVGPAARATRCSRVQALSCSTPASSSSLGTRRTPYLAFRTAQAVAAATRVQRVVLSEQSRFATSR
jgi:hypothetical protein